MAFTELGDQRLKLAQAALLLLLRKSWRAALYYDEDGLGGSAQIQIALLSNKAALAAASFVLI